VIQAQPLVSLLLADAYSELGDYPKAIAAGLMVLELIGPDPGMSMSSAWPPLKFKLSVLPTLAIAAALSGDREQAKLFTAQLEQISLPFMGSAVSRPIKENGLARAYLALGEYEKALEYLGGMSGFGKFSMGWPTRSTRFRRAAIR